MAGVYSPTVRGRRLALELTRLRLRSGLSQTEAARRLGLNKSTLSRIEAASTRPEPEVVRALLQTYGLDIARHDSILHLSEDSWQRGWWTAYGDAFTGNYPMLEDQAEEIDTWETSLVPGLLQTPDYAREILRLRNSPEEDLDRLVAARVARKAVLEKTSPPVTRFVLGEAALRNRIGDDEVMRKQYSALWSTAVEHRNVTVQVVRFDAPPNQGLEGPFTLFGFPSDRGLDVCHSEGALGEWYAESADEIGRLRVAFESVCSAALTPDETVEFLAALARE